MLWFRRIFPIFLKLLLRKLKFLYPRSALHPPPSISVIGQVTSVVCWERKWLVNLCSTACVFPPFSWDLCRSCPLTTPRRYDYRSLTELHRKGILNGKQDANFVAVQSAFRVEASSGTKLKGKEERKWEKGRARETQVPSGERKATYGKRDKCGGYLPWIHKQLWQ